MVLGHGGSKCSLQPAPKWSDEKADGGETGEFREARRQRVGPYFCGPMNLGWKRMLELTESSLSDVELSSLKGISSYQDRH